jgi:phosphoribosylglycinamide formyltransferase-1
MMKKFAVFFSGFGRGVTQIINDYRNNYILPELGLIVSLNPDSEAEKVARLNGIEVLSISPKDIDSNVSFERFILKELRKHGIDYIFLAGYGKILGETLLQAFPNKIANIHPSLLPSFKGHKNGIQQALDFGSKITGVTTHWVDSEMDSGEILLQEAISINGDEFKQLEYRMYHLGCTLQVKTINKFFV